MRVLYHILFICTLYINKLEAQDISVFNLRTEYTFMHNNMEKDETTGFISISEIYPLGNYPDSIVIPAQYLNDGGAKRKVELKGKFRQHLLNSTNIKESDQVNVYAYKRNKIYTFKVKDLNTLAILTPYDDISGAKQPYDYMFGFEVNPNSIPSAEDYLVTIDDHNTFSENTFKPIFWEQVDSSCFPLINKTNSLDNPLNKYISGKTYAYFSDHYNYFVQDVRKKNPGTIARHLVIVSRIDNSILVNRYYRDTESTSLHALNSIEKQDHESLNQWTGILFKDYPPVIFGFLHHSFGCPSIDFIQQPNNAIYINCDNRH